MSGETLTLQSKLVATDDFFKVPVDQRILRNSENECIWKMDWYRTFQDGSVKTEREKTTDRQRAIYLYKMGLDVEGGDHDKKGIEKTKEQDDKSDCYDKWNGDVTENLRQAWFKRMQTSWDLPPRDGAPGPSTERCKS